MKTELIDVLFDTYVYTEANGDPDLTIGLARVRYKLRQEGKDISQADDVAIREFIGKHTQELAAAYKTDRHWFGKTVEDLMKQDAEEAASK